MKIIVIFPFDYRPGDTVGQCPLHYGAAWTEEMVEALAEKDLWRSVIAQAMSDLSLKPSAIVEPTGQPGSINYRAMAVLARRTALANEELKAIVEEAQDWFLEAGRDFRSVCEYADLEPDQVRALALTKIPANLRG